MPSVIRKSDGKVFDVFGTTEGTLAGSHFLIYDKGCWSYKPTYNFMPAPGGPGEIVVTTDAPKEFPPDLRGMFGAGSEHHDPDLEAQ